MAMDDFEDGLSSRVSFTLASIEKHRVLHPEHLDGFFFTGYKMEGMGEWHRLRPGGSKGSNVELVIGVRRSGAPVIPEILLRLRDFS